MGGVILSRKPAISLKHRLNVRVEMIILSKYGRVQRGYVTDQNGHITIPKQHNSPALFSRYFCFCCMLYAVRRMIWFRPYTCICVACSTSMDAGHHAVLSLLTCYGVFQWLIADKKLRNTFSFLKLVSEPRRSVVVIRPRTTYKYIVTKL